MTRPLVMGIGEKYTVSEIITAKRYAVRELILMIKNDTFKGTSKSDIAYEVCDILDRAFELRS